MSLKINEECLSDTIRSLLTGRHIERVFVLGPYSFVLHKPYGGGTFIASAYHNDKHIVNLLSNNIDGAIIKVISRINVHSSETYAFENYAFLLKAMGIYNGMALDKAFNKKPNHEYGDRLLEFKKLLVDFVMSMHSGYFFMEHISPHCRLFEVLYKMRDHVGLYETPEEALLGFFVHKYGDYIDYNDRLGMETACRRILGLKPNINF